MVFEGRTVFYLPIKVGEEIQPGSQRLKLEVEYQACDAYTCFIPRTAVLETSLAIVDANQPVNRVNSALFEGYGTAGAVSEGNGVRFDLFGWTFFVDTSSAAGLILLLVVAAGGGGLLNLTPCVLPVIPIKIIGLAQASDNQARRLVLGAAMSLGVVAFWLALGTMIAGISGLRPPSAFSISAVYDPGGGDYRRHGGRHVPGCFISGCRRPSTGSIPDRTASRVLSVSAS